MHKSAAVIIKVQVVFAALVLLVGVSTNAQAQTSNTARIGITKLASLQFSSIESDAFYWNTAETSASMNTCLQTSGPAIPYRLSASSQAGRDSFHASDAGNLGRIGYHVFWSGARDDYRVSSGDELTRVFSASAESGCDSRSLNIEMDHASYTTAADGAYTDTLSLFFVIE